MTYTVIIPNAGESLGSTRARINTNFQQIASVTAVNHVAFNSSGEGKHKFLQMPEQASAPTTAVNEGGVYTKVGTGPAQTNLFFRAEDSAGTGGFEYQLTRVIEASTARFATNTAYVANHTGGWTFLPGRMLLQYGARTTPGTSGTITFPVAFTTGYYSITIGVTRNASTSTQNVYVNSAVAPSLTTFEYTSTSSGNDPIYWMAVGV